MTFKIGRRGDEAETGLTMLKPCPFCGGKARVEKGWSGNYSVVVCCSCGCKSRFATIERIAVDVWNRREGRM